MKLSVERPDPEPMADAPEASRTEDAPVPPALHVPIELPDGRHVVLRPLLLSDEDPYRLFTQTVSAEAQYYRFFSPRRDLSEREIDHFLHVDYADRMALVAAAGDEIVAVARYDREAGTGCAEVAFIVRDDYQGQGIAPRLLRHLAQIALSLGITCFEASVLPDNTKMLRVFAKSGWLAERRFDDGVIRVTLDIDQPELRDAL